jgi:hypothetical protein
MGKSVTLPFGVMRPILTPACSVNQRFPSGPARMSNGMLAAVGMANSLTCPGVAAMPAPGTASAMTSAPATTAPAMRSFILILPID